jgi:hypothetical protein
MMNNEKSFQDMMKRRQKMLAQTRTQLNKEVIYVEERVDHLSCQCNPALLTQLCNINPGN